MVVVDARTSRPVSDLSPGARRLRVATRHVSGLLPARLARHRAARVGRVRDLSRAPAHGAALAGKPTAEETEKRAAAKHFYDTGMLLYDRGDFVEAAKEFERAYVESPLPELLYNIAQAYDKGGDRKKAVDAYRKYCEVMPSS